MTLGLFTEKLEENQRKIFLFLHESFLGFPEVSCKIRYKIPFYDYHSWVCYINPLKNGAVELCFIKGNKMVLHKHLLQSKGRKMIAGIEIANLNTAPIEEIMECFSEALILDEKIKK